MQSETQPIVINLQQNKVKLKSCTIIILLVTFIAIVSQFIWIFSPLEYYHNIQLWMSSPLNSTLSSNIYKPVRPLNFLIVSLHDSARLELPSILSSMGHNIILHGIKDKRSPYPLAFEKYNFSISQKNELSPFFRHYKSHFYDITENDIKQQ
eukprot:306937_1